MVDNNLTGPISGGVAGAFYLMGGGTTTGTVSFLAMGDPNNNDYFVGSIFASSGEFGPGDFSGTASGSFISNTPFSLGLVANIYQTGAGFSTIHASLSAVPVPEPSVILLMGVGLIGIWGFRKKFKK